MGWASYTLPDGREAGYAVEAECDADGCTTEIDRGLGFLCGRTPGGDEYGCGKYFCGNHLYLGLNDGDMEDWPSLCEPCLDRRRSELSDDDHSGDERSTS